MAKTPEKKKSETKVTRIVASDSSPKKAAKQTAVKTNTKAKVVPAEATKGTRAKRLNPFKRIGGYFKGAWAELRQVRWPDRKATWGMTGALILFTLFFIILIVLLDYGFTQLFTVITGS